MGKSGETRGVERREESHRKRQECQAFSICARFAYMEYKVGRHLISRIFLDYLGIARWLKLKFARPICAGSVEYRGK